MGDHRATVKIEFTFHGKTYQMNSWINWSPDECSGVDQRVLDFFRQATEDGLTRYHEEEMAYHAEQRKKETEENEREQLERLKKKYESP